MSRRAALGAPRCQLRLLLAVALTAGTGCPQLLDDEFRAPGATSAGRGGAGGSSDAAPAGGRAGSAGSTGAAGSAGAAAASRCTEPEIAGPGGRCYLWVSASSSWASARSQCRAHGAGWELMSIRSADDTAFLANLITAEAWAGADDGDGTEVWRWVDDATEFWEGGGAGNPIAEAYVNWNANEPNGSGHDCLRVLPSAFWTDLDCSETRTFICEGPAE